MKIKVEIWITLIGMIAGVISYWFNPYNTMTVMGINIYLLMGSGAFLVSFLLALFLNVKFAKIAFLISTGVLLAIFGRIIFDFVNDSSTHNLFPFEIIKAAFITFLSALFGAYLSRIFMQLKKEN